MSSASPWSLVGRSRLDRPYSLSLSLSLRLDRKTVAHLAGIQPRIQPLCQRVRLFRLALCKGNSLLGDELPAGGQAGLVGGLHQGREGARQELQVHQKLQRAPQIGLCMQGRALSGPCGSLPLKRQQLSAALFRECRQAMGREPAQCWHGEHTQTLKSTQLKLYADSGMQGPLS